MGVLPLQFMGGESPQGLGLTGKEVYDIAGLADSAEGTVDVTATPPDGEPIRFRARVRIDTPKERDYYEHGGILHYMLRQLVSRAQAA